MTLNITSAREASTTTPGIAASVQQLIDAVSGEPSLTPSVCKRLLEASSIEAADLEAWADFDHPVADSYGRKLVYDGGHFELMAMSWVDGDMSAIHDHGYTQWGAVKMFGEAEHAIFRLQDGHLSTAERRRFPAGSVVAVNHDLIHQMGNVGGQPFQSLHLYGAYERGSDITADASLYDLDAGEIQITSGGVFFSLPETAVTRRTEGPSADFSTTLRNKVELRNRLRRCVAAGEPVDVPRLGRLEQELANPDLWRQIRVEVDALSDSSGVDQYWDTLSQELAAALR